MYDMKAQLMALHSGRSPFAWNAALAVILSQTYALAQAAPTAPAAPPGVTEPTPPPATAAPQQPAQTPGSEGTGAVAPTPNAPFSTPESVTPGPTVPVPSTAGNSNVAPAANQGEQQAQDAQADQDAQEAAEDLSDEGGKVNIYGFTDFTYSHLLSAREKFNGSPAPYPSFYVGNFNLYLSADLGHKWRSLSEIRFTYLPDGVQNVTYDTTTYAATYSRTSTAYADYTDYGRTTKVGGVIIERAWLEYAAHPLLTIRGGQWLTPYGIWNVEHGTTVIIGTTRPFIIGSEMFPNHQTGLELYGSYAVESTQVGYNLTLSNGRGPVDTYRDWDKNKALGWRLWLQQDTDFGTFVVGTSGYKGRYTDRYQATNFIPGGAFTFSYPINSEYKELSLAADLKWTWQGAVFQAEAIMHDVVYENSTRPIATTLDFGPQGWAADTRTYGLYAIAGYRLPWLGIMPYFGGEYYHLGKTSFNPDAAAFWGGLNIRPTDRVVLKIQGVHAFFPADWLGMAKAPPMDQLITQAAWSF
jgi:hypothetical protein